MILVLPALRVLSVILEVQRSHIQSRRSQLAMTLSTALRVSPVALRMSPVSLAAIDLQQLLLRRSPCYGVQAPQFVRT